MSLDDSNDMENMDIVDVANFILAALNYPSQITEEELYSDEFYLLVFSTLTTEEEEIKLEPGKTPEEKVENLKIILANLTQLFSEEIPEIDAKKIIMKKDKENAYKLVGLFYTMIQLLIQENMKSEEEKGDLDDEEIKSHSFNDNRMNLSEKKQTEKMRRNKDEEINLENLESLRLGKDKDKKKEKTEKKEEEKEQKTEEEKKQPSSSNKKKALNIEDDDIQLDEISNKIKGSSNKKKKEEEIEIVESSPKSSKKEENIIINQDLEKDLEDDNIDNIDNSEKSSPSKSKKKQITDSEKESGKKKLNEIPNLLGEEDPNNDNNINIIQKAKNQFEDMRLSEQESSDSRFNNTEKRKAHSVSQSLPKLYNPNPEEENEMDFENYNDNEENDFDFEYNQDKNKKEESQSNSNINMENSSHKKTTEINNIENDNDLENNTKSIPQSTDNKKEKDSTKKKEKETTNKKSSNKKEKEIQQQNSEEKKELSEKKNTAEAEGENKGDIADYAEQKNSQEKEENEEPLIEEEYRYEIMKQFKKIYGDKLDNIFLKHNLQNSHNVFELALRNIKLAKQKMMKIENRYPEVDDLKTKEYILRYEKERQMMEAHYNKEQKKINFFEERAINNFRQNMKDIKKAKEIEARKTENEIERRRKAQEVRNYHNQVKFCNEIYQRALELEKEKKIEKMRKKREQNKKENEEKREAMERIENYYKDQIKVLREILENEKKQKEIEHRAHIKFLSTFAKEKRDEYKKELDNIFLRFEQEEKRNEFERKNKKELNKIFDSYYGK